MANRLFLFRLISLATLAAIALPAGCAEDEKPAGAAPSELPEGDEGVEENLTGSVDPTRLLDTPAYFSVSTEALSGPLPRSKYSYPTVWNKVRDAGFGDDVGLRLIVVKGTSAAAKAEAAAQLGKAGVLQNGDVALSFRPNLADTMAYPHIQMGSTHAGLVYVEGDVAHNLDEPLDAEYNKGPDGDWSRLNAPHYAGGKGDPLGTEALHILRPRAFDDARRARLKGWVDAVHASFGALHDQLPFNSDYLAPSYARDGRTTKANVTTLGKIILRQDKTTQIGMFCSEIAWHLLALSNCERADIENAPAEGAACVEQTFRPMPILGEAGHAGLADGPLLTIQRGSAEAQQKLLADLFPSAPNAAKLSSGHRAVAEALESQGLMAGAKGYYQATLAGAPEQAAGIAAQVNQAAPANYSPTAFLVNALLPASDPDRAFDYVATIVFADKGSTYEKAKLLSKQPVP